MVADQSDQPPLEPSGIGQFIKHDRCPRYLKQRVNPGEEPDARDWREAYGVMNIALLGTGKEFEAKQVESLAANAAKIIGPELGDTSKDGLPDITIDETWADSPRGRTAQLQRAVTDAENLSTSDGEAPYILCFQAPLGGKLGGQEVWGKVDCLVLAPTSGLTRNKPTADADADTTTDRPAAEGTKTIGCDSAKTTDTNEPAVVARVLDIKNASEEQAAHRVQVAIYSALLEQTLDEGQLPSCQIETSVLTQETATTQGDPLHAFDLPTFSRHEWELFAERLLDEDGPIDEILNDDLAELPFALTQVCNNCSYREACATRAVEDPTAPASLALLGLDARTQRKLQSAGVGNLAELSELLPRIDGCRPTDPPPTLSLPADQQRELEEILSAPIHEVVQRAQALRSELDPDYENYWRPPTLPGKDWVPLPDDRYQGWSNIDDAEPGELIHVALFVRPDTVINRIGALGACIYAKASDEYVTIGEVIDAVPDDPEVATKVEGSLFERFLDQLFGAIEQVAADVGTPEEAVVHCYTYSTHEQEALVEGLDRHVDTLSHARAMRELCSLHPDGHTGVDQSMLSAVQPVVNEHFALTYPSQGLLAVAEQFVRDWTLEAFDPLDARGDDPPLRAIFDEQFLKEQVPYLNDPPGIRLHLARGRLAEGPAADAVEAENPSPDGWYPIRKRAGAQFPVEYIWAVSPRHPDEKTPRLTPSLAEEWAIDDEHAPLYKQEINRFVYRTGNQTEPLQRADVEYLVERLSYTLMRLVEAIPHKDSYHRKEPIDATQLSEFSLPVTHLPEVARDYLRIEFGTRRENTLAHYRQSLRERARSGRSVPIRCTDIEHQDDGSLVIEGELAYDVLFEDPETAQQVAQQARIRSGHGNGGGSWRVLTRLQTSVNADASEASQKATGAGPSSRDTTAALTVEKPSEIKHSPPVLVEAFDATAGTITVTAFGHRFRQNGSRFRVAHCGWQSPEGSNISNPEEPPTECPGYVAEREPVWVDTDEVYMLDPMVDDFGAPKADRALRPETITENVLWRQLQTIHQTGRLPATMVADPGTIEAFLDTVAASDACLTPNEKQRAFIRAVGRAIVPLQGPPGTGKTSGATAPALLARAYARAQEDESFVGIVVAPSHEAVDAVLSGVVDSLEEWRRDQDGLESLQLVRVLPSTPPAANGRADARATAVDVTYANYHSTDGEATLQELATDVLAGTADPAEPSQCLIFTTPATLYRMLGIVAATLSAIDGDSAPAAMRHPDGLADVICIDEASMLTLPQLLLAGSVLKPAGQTLLVGDHRQLATVSETDWNDILRKPLATTKAYLSALEYIQWLNERLPDGGRKPAGDPPTGTHQTRLTGLDDPAATAETDGDGQ